MLKKTIFIMVITVSLITMISAQGWRQNRANPPHTFDVTAPVEIEGKIVKMESTTKNKGRYRTSTHLTIADSGKQFPVSLGPTAYLDSQRWSLKEGENIKIKVFKGTGNDNGTFFAAEINRDGQQLILRDENGLPMWRANLDKRGGRNARGRRGCGRGVGRYYNQ